MSFGSVDSRVGAGQVVGGTVRQPTHTIPADCMCSWSVVRPGPGMECLSDLRYRNTLCRHPHKPTLAAVRGVPRAS
jgi:hypothetical protein